MFLVCSFSITLSPFFFHLFSLCVYTPKAHTIFCMLLNTQVFSLNTHAQSVHEMTHTRRSDLFSEDTQQRVHRLHVAVSLLSSPGKRSCCLRLLVTLPVPYSHVFLDRLVTCWLFLAFQVTSLATLLIDTPFSVCRECRDHLFSFHAQSRREMLKNHINRTLVGCAFSLHVNSSSSMLLISFNVTPTRAP